MRQVLSGRRGWTCWPARAAGLLSMAAGCARPQVLRLFMLAGLGRQGPLARTLAEALRARWEHRRLLAVALEPVLSWRTLGWRAGPGGGCGGAPPGQLADREGP